MNWSRYIHRRITEVREFSRCYSFTYVTAFCFVWKNTVPAFLCWSIHKTVKRAGVHMIVPQPQFKNTGGNDGKSKKLLYGVQQHFSFELKPRDFIVYCCLLKHSDNKEKSCFSSRKIIAKECCMDKEDVDSTIKSLSDKWFLKKVIRHRADGTMTCNLYYLNDLLDTG